MRRASAAARKPRRMRAPRLDAIDRMVRSVLDAYMARMNEGRYREAENALWAAVGVTPIERFVDLPRAGLRVRCQEVGDGPPVLFVHGANTSGLSWATLAAKLVAFRCILVDRPEPVAAFDAIASWPPSWISGWFRCSYPSERGLDWHQTTIAILSQRADARLRLLTASYPARSRRP